MVRRTGVAWTAALAAASVGCAQLSGLTGKQQGGGRGGSAPRESAAPREPAAPAEPTAKAAPATGATAAPPPAERRERGGPKASAAPLDPARRDQAAADEAWLLETWARLEAPLREACTVRYPTNHLGTHGSYRELRAEAFARLKQAEPLEAELPQVREKLAALEARWGTDDSDRIRAALGEAQGKRREETAGLSTAHHGLTRWPKEIAPARQKAAADLVRQVDAYLAANTWVRYGEARANLELAQRLAPSDALAARLAGWDQEVARHKAENGPKIAAAALPVHLKNFSGPGDPEALAKAACELLAAPADYAAEVWLYDHQGPWTFHRAWVRAQWEAEETVLGRPTRWWLFFLVAISDEEMAADGVAALIPFHLSCAEQAERATGWNKGKWEEHLQERRVYVRLDRVR